MKILLASDHAGFELKSSLVTFLQDLSHEVEDLGPYAPAPEDDYPDFIMPLARQVAGSDSIGIAIGGSGQGEAMAANRIPGARAAVYYGGPLDIVRLSREHNDANVLSLGARLLDFEQAKEAVSIFITTAFSGEERHVRRIEKLDEGNVNDGTGHHRNAQTYAVKLAFESGVRFGHGNCRPS